MSSVRVPVEDQDVDYDVIAEQLARDCEEDAFLCALAQQNDAIATQSTDATEKAFSVEAARRLRELAAWFTENYP